MISICKICPQAPRFADGPEPAPVPARTRRPRRPATVPGPAHRHDQASGHRGYNGDVGVHCEYHVRVLELEHDNAEKTVWTVCVPDGPFDTKLIKNMFLFV
jgi:hypothetical protein